MNQKKAKALRKAMRAAGIDPRSDTTVQQPKLNLLTGFYGQRALMQNTGRAIYQRTKRIGISRAAA